MGGVTLYLSRRDPVKREFVFLFGEEEVGHLARGEVPEMAATGELFGRVWHIRHEGFRPLRAYVYPAGSAIPEVVLVGSASWGLARTRGGRALRFLSQIDPHEGPGSGFEDLRGNRVLWSLGRHVPGLYRLGFVSEIRLENLEPRSRDAAALLLVSASLNLFRIRRLMVQVGTLGLSADTVEAEMDRILRHLLI